jgi:hypothetical protein
MVFRRSLEMSISREEFFRLLAAIDERRGPDGSSLAPIESSPEATTIRWFDAGRPWTIRLVPLPDRHLGSVTVPRHRVDIALEACSDDDGEAFMTRFHRAFLRGGG